MSDWQTEDEITQLMLFNYIDKRLPEYGASNIRLLPMNAVIDGESADAYNPQIKVLTDAGVINHVLIFVDSQYCLQITLLEPLTTRWRAAAVAYGYT